MKTKKIYQQNVYKKNFESQILDFFIDEDGAVVVLDETIFFPTGGGQSCDRGTIKGYPVTDVYEKSGIIYHKIDISLKNAETFNKGLTVKSELDWEHRFDNMQRHCGEHILSGMFFREYGGVNRGFHMGEDYMTVDISMEENPQFKTLTWDMAEHVEMCANEAIWSNAPVITRHFDSGKEAANLPLRKALAIDKDITIVCVGDTENPSDCVACCGTHPNTAGQVGIIKLYKVEPNKGMFRVYFESGKRALVNFEEKHNLIEALGRKYSAGEKDLLKKIQVQDEKSEEMRKHLNDVRKTVIDFRLKEIVSEYGILDKRTGLYCFSELNADDIRNLGKKITQSLSEHKCPKVIMLYDEKSCTLMLFSDGKTDCCRLIKDNGAVYGGRGGGRPESAQAKFDSTENIKLFADAIDKILIRD